MDNLAEVRLTVYGKDWPDLLARTKVELQSFYPDQSWDLEVDARPSKRAWQSVEGEPGTFAAAEVQLWEADVVARPQAMFSVVPPAPPEIER